MHACSDGEKVYSFLSMLINILGIDKAHKYLPISARDIDRQHISIAKSAQHQIEPYEREHLIYELKQDYAKYFDEQRNDIFYDNITVKDILKNKVKFQISNILEDVKKLKFKNTVLFAWNFWPYLDNEDADKLAMNLSQKMDKSSTLIIGDFDKTYNIDMLLYQYGFKKSNNASNVFIKEEKNIAQQIHKLVRFLQQILNYKRAGI